MQSLGIKHVVPPQKNHVDRWPFDAELSKCRNEIERLFGQIKLFPRVFTHYDKSNLMIRAFITLVFIAVRLR